MVQDVVDVAKVDKKMYAEEKKKEENYKEHLYKGQLEYHGHVCCFCQEIGEVSTRLPEKNINEP